MMPVEVIWCIPVICVTLLWMWFSRAPSEAVFHVNGRWRRRLGDAFETMYHIGMAGQPDDLHLLSYVHFMVSKQPLSFDVIKEALHHLSQKHPLLRARYLKDGDVHYFEEMPNIVIPLSVCEDTEWESSHENNLLKPYDRHNGPLWRCIYLPNTQTPSYVDKHYPHQMVLVFGFHHSIIDGTSSVILLKELVTLLSSLPQSDPMVLSSVTSLPVPLSVENLVPIFSPSWSDRFMNLLSKYGMAMRLLNLKFSSSAMEQQFVWFDRYQPAIDKNPNCQIRTCLMPVTFPRTVMEKMVCACKAHKTTMQAFLQTAASVAFVRLYNDDKEIPSDIDLNLGPTISLRKLFPQQLSKQSAVAGYFCFRIMQLTVVSQWKQQFWNMVSQCHQRIHGDLVQAAVSCNRYIRRNNLFVKSGSQAYTDHYASNQIRRYNVTMAFTNLGDCSFVNEADAGVKVTARFGGSGEHRIGPLFSNGIATIDEKLCWGIHYYPHITERAVVLRYIELLKDTLDQLLP